MTRTRYVQVWCNNKKTKGQTMSIQFRKAERVQAKVKLAVTGPSGAGKTFSALRLASGLGSKVAVIDTENGSASLYSEQFAFDVLEITPPFTTEKYIAAVNVAEKAGYDVVVIDSITHAWAGEGGLLEQKEQLDARGRGNSYTNWGLITKKQEAFKSALLQAPIHIITTMRSKQEYAQIEGDGGKKSIKKLGLAPIQRDGMEYEFTIVFDVAMNHQAEVSKDRTGLFADKIFTITEDTGKEILSWLSTAKVAEKKESAIKPTLPMLEPKVIKSFLDELFKMIPDKAAAKTFCEKVTGKQASSAWAMDDIEKMRDELMKLSESQDTKEVESTEQDLWRD
jgi:Cdc6-like AAA superfamily ATPase